MDESLRHVTVLDARAGGLQGLQRNDYSQFGEDGLVEAVFARIGETNRWCFEVGAADGLFFSNTKRMRDAGWSAVLIEENAESCRACRQYESNKVQVVNEAIGPGNPLEGVLSRCRCPTDCDFGVIDIDGQDYWAWLRMEAYRPRVMLVEYNYAASAILPPEGGAGQAGLQDIVKLGQQKGYVALAKTYCNVLFVEQDAWPQCA